MKNELPACPVEITMGLIYSLTDTGLSLKPILDSMVIWGNEYREMKK